MNRQEKLRHLSIRQQVLLERFKVSEVRAVVKPLDRILVAAERALGTLKGKEISEASRTELNRVLVKLEKDANKVFETATKRIYKRLPEFADVQSDIEGQALEVIGPKLRISIPSESLSYARALSEPVQVTGEFFETFIGNWSNKEVNRLNTLFTNGWSQGATNQRLIQGLRGTKANNYRDGIIFSSKRNAQAIVRTAIQHVANSSRMATWEENKDVVTGYRWVSTLDSVTTKQCRALDGEVFKLGKGPRPPLHYNCRSTTVAELDEKLGLEFLDEGATRSSVNGYVPAKQNFYEWLKEQPKGFQNQAIGPRWAKLFRDGGLSPKRFADLSLDKNFKPLTLAQFKKAAPKAFEKAGLN